MEFEHRIVEIADNYAIQLKRKVFGLIPSWYFVKKSNENFELTRNPFRAYKFATKTTAENHVKEISEKL